MATGVINQTYGLRARNRGLMFHMKMTDYFGCPSKIFNNIMDISIFAIIEMIVYFAVRSHYILNKMANTNSLA